MDTQGNISNDEISENLIDQTKRGGNESLQAIEQAGTLSNTEDGLRVLTTAITYGDTEQREKAISKAAELLESQRNGPRPDLMSADPDKIGKWSFRNVGDMKFRMRDFHSSAIQKEERSHIDEVIDDLQHNKAFEYLDRSKILSYAAYYGTDSQVDSIVDTFPASEAHIPCAGFHDPDTLTIRMGKHEKEHRLRRQEQSGEETFPGVYETEARNVEDRRAQAIADQAAEERGQRQVNALGNVVNRGGQMLVNVIKKSTPNTFSR